MKARAIVAVTVVVALAGACDPASDSAGEGNSNPQSSSSTSSTSSTSSSSSSSGAPGPSDAGTNGDSSSAVLPLRLLTPPSAPLSHDFGCSGAGQSPAVQWDREPMAASYALVVVDESIPAPNTHWVVYDMHLHRLVSNVPEGYEVPASIGDGIMHQTPSSFSDTAGYFPPCPPTGETHDYRFTVHALDVATLPVTMSSTIDEVIAAIKAHSIESASNVPTYKRK